MKKRIKRLEMHTSAFLEGIGHVMSTLPMTNKTIPLEMYYDDAYPHMVFLRSGSATNFIPLTQIKSGSFEDEESVPAAALIRKIK